MKRMDCTECGAAFNATGRDVEGGAPDERLFEADHYGCCPACQLLGNQSPPRSPCCAGETLHGTGDEDFECNGCGLIFAIEPVRLLALGEAVLRLCRQDRPHLPNKQDRLLAIGSMVLHEARNLGAI